MTFMEKVLAAACAHTAGLAGCPLGILLTVPDLSLPLTYSTFMLVYYCIVRKVYTRALTLIPWSAHMINTYPYRYRFTYEYRT